MTWNLEPGKVIAGEWRIVEKIGSGQEGPVYHARHEHDDSDVALKVAGWDDAASIRRKGERFARWHHPNLLRVITHGVHAERDLKMPFLITELLGGGSLDMHLDGIPVELHQTRTWMLELLAAVSFLHAHSAYHRDIKPANILLDDAGSLRLADPGLVFFRDADGGHDARLGWQQPGSLAYQSPELRNGDAGPGTQSDLWSCCCLLHELATGSLPDLNGELDLGSAGLADELVDVLRVGLHADPARRYENADVLASAIASAIPSGGIAPVPTQEDYDWYTLVLDAIDVEIEAENRRCADHRTSARCKIDSESYLDEDALEWMTLLAVTDDIRIAEGDTCAVTTSARATTRCRAIDITGDQYTLASSTRIIATKGEQAELAETRVDLLREFRQAVVDAPAAEWHDREIAAQVFDVPGSTSADSPEPSPADPLPGRRPNADQQAAIDHALVAQVSYLWGPPGTGKTEVIAQAVHHAARAGERTLIVSATNVAVDTALERVLRKALDITGSPPSPGEYARAGTIRPDGMLRSWRHAVDTARIALDNDPVLRKQVRDARARLRKDPADAEAQQVFADAIIKMRHAASGIERQATAVGTTIHQCFLDPERFAGFDLVVIDEASMVPSTMVWFAAGLATRRVVISGDFRQLPPVITSDPQIDDAERMHLLKDPFEVSGIAALVRSGRWPACLHALTIQYRMQPQIAELVTAIAYRDNPLKTGDGVLRLGRRVFHADHDVVFIDTSSLRPVAVRSPGSPSSFNAVHAAVTIDVLACLAQSRYLAPQDCGIEVLTPYANQSRLLHDGLKALMGRHGLPPRSVRVSTVHRFQGQQRSAVVLELTPSKPREALGRLLGDRNNSMGTRLLNVAASRAQDTLIIIGNLDWLTTYRDQYSGLDRLLHAVSENGLAIDALDLLADPRYGTHHADVLDSNGYLARFNDLASQARRTLVVHSQCATKSGLKRGLGVLEDAAQRGVRVRICVGDVTRGGADEQRLADLAAGVGIAVDVRSIPVESMTVADEQLVLVGGFAPLGGRPLTGSASACFVDNRGLAHRLVRLASLPRRGTADGTRAEHEPCSKCGSPMRLEALRDGELHWSCVSCGHRREEPVAGVVEAPEPAGVG